MVRMLLNYDPSAFGQYLGLRADMRLHNLVLDGMHCCSMLPSIRMG